MAWGINVDRFSASAPWDPGSSIILSPPWRRYEVKDYGPTVLVVPLTDEDYLTGEWREVTAFSTPIGERHFVRIDPAVRSEA